MLHLADRSLAVRQIIASGRVAERITDRPVARLTGALLFRSGSTPWHWLPAQFVTYEAGYFAFSLLPERDLPNVSNHPSVTLRAEFGGHAAPFAVEKTMAGSEFGLNERLQTIAGNTVRVRTIRGAPFDLSTLVDPTPVALSGIVLRNHDPAEPVAGIAVTAGPASTVTDATGRFWFSSLPLSAQVLLTLTEGATQTSFPTHIDFGRPVNHVTLSLS